MTNWCKSCGKCCRLFMINLSREEYISGKYRTMFEKEGKIDDFKQAASCGANFLAKKDDGSCVYLEEGKCSIHNDRPTVCRKFFCTTKAKKYQGMVKIIREEKT